MRIILVMHPNKPHLIPLSTLSPGDVAVTSDGTMVVCRAGAIFGLEKNLYLSPSEVARSALMVTRVESGTRITLEIGNTLDLPRSGDLFLDQS